MPKHSGSSYFAYLFIVILATSGIASIPFLGKSYASHENIAVEVEDMIYDQGDSVTITGTIEDVEDDQVKITVIEPDGSDEDENVDLENNGDFSFEYELSSSADDGVYTVKATYDGDSVYSYFIVDEEDDDVTVVIGSDLYDPGDEVEIEGRAENPQTGVDEVEITILDPTNDELIDSHDEEIDDDDEFTYAFDLDNDASHGRYAVIVTYDDGDEGYAVFDVTDEGESDDEPITVELNKSTYKPGDTVEITGEVQDVVSNEDEVEIIVTDSDDNEIVDDTAAVESNGDFEFDFELDDDAESGEYTIVISYDGEEVEATFDVSTSTTSGGSSSSSGLTVKLNKSSYLAGETMTVTGKVPKLVKDAVVNVDVFDPDGLFTGSFATTDPESDLTYSATLKLKSTLATDKNYKVEVNYGTYQGQATFSITGLSSTSSDEITVKTDKKEYASGSTIIISGTVSPDLIIDGEQVLVRINKPDGNPYRIDLTDLSSSGSYSYDVVVGGSLASAGSYEVVVTYNEEDAKTKFDLTGGAPAKAKYNLKVEDDSYPIEYEIQGGQLKSMFVKPSDNKLVVSIDATEDGQIVLVLPRDVIDSEEDGSDKKYVVATADLEAGAGNDNVSIKETATDSDSRTIVIDYKKGTDLIEISGTSVVPEFGQIAGIVLAISIVAIVVVTARIQRGKLGDFMPFKA